MIVTWGRAVVPDSTVIAGGVLVAVTVDTTINDEQMRLGQPGEFLPIIVTVMAGAVLVVVVVTKSAVFVSVTVIVDISAS